MKVINMVKGLSVLSIVLKNYKKIFQFRNYNLRIGRELRGKADGGNVTNVQYKSHWNCLWDSPITNIS
jgi:hypothetical protein